MTDVDVDTRIAAIEAALKQQQDSHEAAIKTAENELSDLRKAIEDVQCQCRGLTVVKNGMDLFTRRVEWTISDFSKQNDTKKGESIWSPKFRAGGIDGMQLEFFPSGREKTTYDGFCSLFLWCPADTHLRYQLWVGSFKRAPDEDEYTGRIGHGHSNFCPMEPEIDQKTDSVTVGVDLLDVTRTQEFASKGLRLISTSIEKFVLKEVEVQKNAGVSKAMWKIKDISRHVKELPKGASMWSPLFTAAGIRDILLEFYPNGSMHTTKEGYCSFYIRCPEGVTLVVSLIVGNTKKGPIKTTFDSLTGKGLPDFCLLADELANFKEDVLEVGIELQKIGATLQVES